MQRTRSQSLPHSVCGAVCPFRRALLRIDALLSHFRHWWRMRNAGVSQAELARILRLDSRQVRRMLDPLTSSRVEELERALAALGKRLEIRVRDAA